MNTENELNEMKRFVELMEDSGVTTTGPDKLIEFATELLGARVRESWQQVVVEAAMVGRRHGVRFVKQADGNKHLDDRLVRLMESCGFTFIEAQRVVLNIADHGAYS